MQQTLIPLSLAVSAKNRPSPSSCKTCKAERMLVSNFSVKALFWSGPPFPCPAFSRPGPHPLRSSKRRSYHRITVKKLMIDTKFVFPTDDRHRDRQSEHDQLPVPLHVGARRRWRVLRAVLPGYGAPRGSGGQGLCRVLSRDNHRCTGRYVARHARVLP